LPAQVAAAPPFTNIRKISAHIAAAVAAKAYELGTHVLCFDFADTIPHLGIHHQKSHTCLIRSDIINFPVQVWRPVCLPPETW
jgi:hypothetical protein